MTSIVSSFLFCSTLIWVTHFHRPTILFQSIGIFSLKKSAFSTGFVFWPFHNRSQVLSAEQISSRALNKSIMINRRKLGSKLNNHCVSLLIALLHRVDNCYYQGYLPSTPAAPWSPQNQTHTIFLKLRWGVTKTNKQDCNSKTLITVSWIHCLVYISLSSSMQVWTKEARLKVHRGISNHLLQLIMFVWKVPQLVGSLFQMIRSYVTKDMCALHDLYGVVYI